MARVHFGPEGINWSGKLGKSVYRTINGRTYIQRLPNRRSKKKPPTPRQEVRHELTREAGWYGSDALNDPKLRPIYEAIARWEGKPVVSMANRDAFRRPVVEEIDASAYGGEPGDVIAIAASDDTGVVSVDMVVADADGEALETGPADLDASGWWLYKAQTQVPEGSYVRVVARAIDRPEGTGLGSLEIVVERRRSRAKRPRRRHIPHGGNHPAIQGAGADELTANSPSPAGVARKSTPHSTGVAPNSVPHDPSVAPNSMPDGMGVAPDSVPLGATARLDPARLVHEARRRAGLSQRELARRAGTSRSVVRRVEMGQASPTVETLIRLLRAAGFEVVAGLVEGSI